MDKKVILCVDDEEIILNSLEVQLQEHFGDQYVYEFAEDPSTAFEVIEELTSEGAHILMIVSDWLMPDKRGDEFLIDVHKRFPEIVKVMLTGQADDESVQNAKIHANLYSCLHKPWDNAELIETISSGLDNVFA